MKKWNQKSLTHLWFLILLSQLLYNLLVFLFAPLTKGLQNPVTSYHFDRQPPPESHHHLSSGSPRSPQRVPIPSHFSKYQPQQSFLRHESDLVTLLPKTPMTDPIPLQIKSDEALTDHCSPLCLSLLTSCSFHFAHLAATTPVYILFFKRKRSVPVLDVLLEHSCLWYTWLPPLPTWNRLNFQFLMRPILLTCLKLQFSHSTSPFS